MSEITPSQTVGPFFAYGLAPKGRAKWDPNGTYSWKETIGDNLITPDATGTKIHIEGSVLDGDGMPINDAMIEIWQADSQGRYVHARGEQPRPNAKFTGFGRSARHSHCPQAARQRRPQLPFRHPRAGRRRDGFLRYLKTLAPAAGCPLNPSATGQRPMTTLFLNGKCGKLYINQ